MPCRSEAEAVRHIIRLNFNIIYKAVRALADYAVFVFVGSALCKMSLAAEKIESLRLVFIQQKHSFAAENRFVVRDIADIEERVDMVIYPAHRHGGLKAVCPYIMRNNAAAVILIVPLLFEQFFAATADFFPLDKK